MQNNNSGIIKSTIIQNNTMNHFEQPAYLNKVLNEWEKCLKTMVHMLVLDLTLVDNTELFSDEML